MTRVPDNQYVDATLASLYDITNRWSEDNAFYLSLADKPTMAVLDLGCGTGLLCNAYAGDGHSVVGVDPAAAMLHEAAKKQYAGKVEWVNTYAEDFQNKRLFDLITMTGHAFQVFLERTEVLKLLNVVCRHLKPDGRFVFESRNPLINWENEWHGRSLVYISALGGVTETITVEHADDDFVEFTTSYQIGVDELSSHSRLRFFSEAAIKTMLLEAGLELTHLYGDWNRSEFTEASAEMIFVVHKQACHCQL